MEADESSKQEEEKKEDEKPEHPEDRSSKYDEHAEMITTNIMEHTVPATDQTVQIIQGPPVYENHQELYTLAFPTLFPYGKATMFDEMHKAGQTANARKALKMLMKRAQIIDGELRFPFQENDRFMYWCLNKIMRSEALYE